MPLRSLQRLLGRLRTRHVGQRAVVTAFAVIVAQVRRAEFYRDLAVPDTLDGRFDMVALHVFLVMHRLKREGAGAAEWSRRLLELMVEDFDRSLRELGTGDGAIGRRIKTMMKGINGRLHAYDGAIGAGGVDAGADPLAVALDNNLYGTVPGVPAAHLATMAAYMRREAAALADQPASGILSGALRFGSPPASNGAA